MMVKHDFDWSKAPRPWCNTGPAFRRECERIVGVKASATPAPSRVMIPVSRDAPKTVQWDLRLRPDRKAVVRADHADRLRAAEAAINGYT